MSYWVRKAQQEVPVTTYICAAIIVVFVVTAVQSRSLLNNAQASELADAWVLYLPAMQSSPWGVFRALGAAFIHIGPVHLGMNLVLLFLFGRELEQALGHAAFAVSFFTGAIGASAVILWMDPLAPTAGVSGAVYALMAMLVGVVFQNKDTRQLRGLVALIAVNIGFTILWSDFVSVWGHLGGLFIGIVLAIVILTIRQKGVRLVVLIAVLTICCCAVYLRAAGLSTATLAVAASQIS